ncbi:MAG: glycosyltransferase family 39 protein [Bacteroidota bacterium]
MLKKDGNKWSQWLLLGLFLAIAYGPLFLHLDVQPLKNFDESFFGLRAYRLAHYGEYLYNYKQFPEGPSATNLKPPFFSAIQAGFFKVVGYNELALRLPVALTILALLLGMLWIGNRHFESSAYGQYAALALLTSTGFINVHVTRTGDHDGVLAAMGFLALWCLYCYLHGERKDPRWMYGLAASLVAATLTKSVAGLFFAPGMLVYVLYKRQLVALLKDKHFWFGVGGFAFCVAGYYLYREWDAPGFLQNLQKGELGGHYLKTRDGHVHPYLWYWDRLINLKYAYWFLPALFGLLVSYHPRFKKWRDWHTLLWMAWLSWMLVISSSQTKLEWYDASLYPIMAMWVGLGLTLLYYGLRDFLKLEKGAWPYIIKLAFVLLFFALPYKTIIQKVYAPKDNDYPGEYYGYLMEQAEDKFPDLKQYTLMFDGYSFHCLFYQLVYNQQKGYDIRRERKVVNLQVGETAMLCQPQTISYLEENFVLEYLTGKQGCKLVKILREK